MYHKEETHMMQHSDSGKQETDQKKRMKTWDTCMMIPTRHHNLGKYKLYWIQMKCFDLGWPERKLFILIVPRENFSKIYFSMEEARLFGDIFYWTKCMSRRNVIQAFGKEGCCTVSPIKDNHQKTLLLTYCLGHHSCNTTVLLHFSL